MTIEVILFDWGGTLTATVGQPEALHKGALEVARILTGRADDALAVGLARRAMEAEKQAAAHESCREVDLAELLAEWAAALGRPTDSGRIDAAVRAVGEHWVGSALAPLPGALEAVAALRRRGYRMGVVSNCWIPPRYCRQELDREGFGALMDFAVFSSAVSYRKPSPIIYEAALKESYPAGRPDDLSRVLFVGDSPTADVAGPAKMGMRTALVTDIPGIWPENDFVGIQPDLRIHTVADLPAALDGLPAPTAPTAPHSHRP